MNGKSWYLVVVRHGGLPAGEEVVLAKDSLHAHKLAAYVSPTVARDHVNTLDFDRSRVTWEVHPVEGATAA